MVSRYLDIYNRWLWAAVILLMLFGLLAPISTALSKVSIGLALGLTFARFGAEAWQKRQQRDAEQASTGTSAGD